MKNHLKSWTQSSLNIFKIESLLGIFTLGLVLILVLFSVYYIGSIKKRQESIEQLQEIIIQRDKIVGMNQSVLEDLQKSLNENLLYKFSGKEMYRFQSIYSLSNARTEFNKLFFLANTLVTTDSFNVRLLRVKELMDDYDKVLTQSLNQEAEEFEDEEPEISDLIDSMAIDSVIQAKKNAILSNKDLVNIKSNDQLIRVAELNLIDITNMLSGIIDSVEKKTRDQLEEVKKKQPHVPFVIFSLILAGIFIFVVWLIYKYISQSISKSGEILTSIANGDIPEEDKMKLGPEFRKIAEANTQLISYIDNAGKFAQKIGEGQFNYEFQQKGKNDALGNSLLDMRERLVKVTKEDKIRNWVNEGQARFGELLRIQTDDLSQFGDQLLKNLVDYIGADQGGLFIINNENEDDTYLELLSAYAFKRKKFKDKRIDIGEGLIGQVFQEGKTRYMIEITDEHFEITTGLGESKPSCLLIVPLKEIDSVEGIIEIASFKELEDYKIRFVEDIAASIASALRIGRVNQQTKMLLLESQEKAEAMKAQEDELVHNMEELAATHEQLERHSSEMQELQEKLQKEQYLLHNLLKYTPDAVYFKDLNSRFLRLSNSMIRKYKLDDVESIIGKTDFDFHDEEHAKDAFEDEQRIIATSIPIVNKVEKEVLKDGSVEWVSTSKMPLRDENDNIVGTFGISSDITRFKVLEDSFNKRQRWIERCFKKTNVDLIVLDANGKIYYASSNILSKIGKDDYKDLNYTNFFISPGLDTMTEKIGLDKGEVKEVEMQYVLNDSEMTKIKYRSFANSKEDEYGIQYIFILSKQSL